MFYTIRPPEELPKVEELVFDRLRLLPSMKQMDTSGPANTKKSAIHSKLNELQKFVFYAHMLNVTASEILLLKFYCSKKWTLDDFDVGRGLGGGMFCQTYMATDKKSHTKVAMKVVCKNQILHNDQVGQVRREIEIQHHLK
jgi:hypothetical protein